MQRFSLALTPSPLPLSFPHPYNYYYSIYLPICHKELGPATEYGCLLTNPAGNLFRPPNGSMDLRVLRTRSLVTFMPLAHRLPQINCTPEYGQSCLICWICDMRSSLLISFTGSCNRPYSSLRLQ